MAISAQKAAPLKTVVNSCSVAVWRARIASALNLNGSSENLEADCATILLKVVAGKIEVACSRNCATSFSWRRSLRLCLGTFTDWLTDGNATFLKENKTSYARNLFPCFDGIDDYYKIEIKLEQNSKKIPIYKTTLNSIKNKS